LPFISSHIPATPTSGVNISQLLRHSRTCDQYSDFLGVQRLSTDAKDIQTSLRCSYTEVIASKNYTVVITNWFIATKYPILKWYYADYVFPLLPTRLLQDLTSVISGAGTAYPSGAPEFTPGF